MISAHVKSLFIGIFAMLFMLQFSGLSPADASLVKQRETATEASAPTASPGLWTRTVHYIQVQQQSFYRKLAGAVKEVKANRSFEAAWSLVFLSFIYGIFHAAGPGHGKTVISAYLLANEAQVRRGVVLAFLSSAMQAVTAILLVGIVVMILGLAGRSAQRSVLYLEQTSYAMICAVGLYMLWRVLSPLLRSVHVPQLAPAGHGHDHVHDHGHGHDDGHGHDHDHHDHAHGHVHDHDEHGNCACGHTHIPDAASLEKPLTWQQGASIVFAIGIRPCSGAVLVLVFANAIGIFMAGMVATFAMALGTALTVSALAVLTLLSKSIATRLLGRNARWLDWTARVFGVTGAVLVFLIGAVLLAGSFGPQRPFI